LQFTANIGRAPNTIDAYGRIPSEAQWPRILAAARQESPRNRLMVAFAYDGALRREELVSLEIGDVEPAYSLIRLRAVTTKSRRSREVAFGAAASALFVAYLRQRRAMFGRADGSLFLSESRRPIRTVRSTNPTGQILNNLHRIGTPCRCCSPTAGRAR
jgi:integrase